LLFTENETNTHRIFKTPNRTPYVKDAFDSYFVHGCHDATNPAHEGTKATAHYPVTVSAGASRSIRVRLHEPGLTAPFSSFDAEMQARRTEADQFYKTVIPGSLDADRANVMRQALGGMLWSKQFYYYNVDQWLDERGAGPYKPRRRAAPRNDHWH